MRSRHACEAALDFVTHGVRLRVRDDGRGFDSAVAQSRGAAYIRPEPVAGGAEIAPPYPASEV